MKRREFIKGFAAMSAAPFMLKSIKQDTTGEELKLLTNPDDIEQAKGFRSDTVLWCKLDFTAYEVDKNSHSMKAIEKMVDAKLDHAKGTIMALFEENL
jgi:hypothetical protein